MNEKIVLDFAMWTQPFFLWYFAGINLFYTFLIILGSFKIYFRHKELEEENFISILQSNSLPTIAFLIPMYNESGTIVDNVKNIRRLSYRYKKILIVNDGSTDDSVNLLIKTFDMVAIPKFYEDVIPCKNLKAIYQSKSHPEMMLLDKEHGGKFDALNAGVNGVNASFFVVVDADTFVDDAGFEALIRPVLINPKTIAVGGSVRIKNGCILDYNRISTSKFPDNYLTSMQGIEYIRVFLTRLGWDYFNGNFIIAGAFSLFPRDLIAKVGGFCDSVGEDVEITIRLHRIMKEKKIKYKLFYIPDPVAWSVGPEKWGTLAKQRTRWHLAILETFYHHKKMLFNPRYGFLGLFVYPFWIFAEVLEPVIEVMGYCYILFCVWTQSLQIPFLIFYLTLSFGLVFLYTFYCLLIEDLSFRKYPSIRSLFLMFVSCLIENIGYHQLSLYWRFKGFYHFIKRLPEIRKESKRIKAKIAKAKNL